MKFSSKTTLADMQAIRAALLDKMTSPASLPITFKVGDTAYAGLSEAFAPKTVRKIIDANIVSRIYTGKIPGTSLRITVDCQEYKDFPVWEWLATIENEGEENSPVISELTAINTTLPAWGDVTLCWNNGDNITADSLTTTCEPMPVGSSFHAQSAYGRSCEGAWPYYRILTGEYAYNIAIGWPGNWSADFLRTEQGISFLAKQTLTNFYLKPGEVIRTPRIVMMALKGDSDRAINLWRRFGFAHLLSRSEGNPLDTKLYSCYGAGGEEFTLATEENQIAAIQSYLDHGHTPDIWWIDAGWYPCKDETGTKHWWFTGDWQIDREKFPSGLGPVGKFCKDHGIDLLLWFEPERIRPKYWPGDNPVSYMLTIDKEKHPDWMDRDALLNLGDEEAREWITRRVIDILKEGNVTVYRQDFNGRPFPEINFVENDDGPDRAGIVENLHIQGMLRFWDDMAFEIPDLWIDNCASGGRRNDIECMRRSVALHPTDYGYGYHPVKQAFQKTWYQWLPYFRSIADAWDDEEGNYLTGKPAAYGRTPYSAHCAFAPCTDYGIGPYASDAEFAAANEMADHLRRAMPYTLNSNFFCYTPTRLSNEDYFVIHFAREEDDSGLIQVIRNTRCEDESITVFPKAFEDGKTYEFEAPEIGQTFTASGAEINETGLTVSISKRSGIFWFYRALRD